VCGICGGAHDIVKLDDEIVIKELSYNYYIPHNKCAHYEDDRYCILVSWENFKQDPNKYIEEAFLKREHPISNKIKVYP
jgi:hypothetical protein